MWRHCDDICIKIDILACSSPILMIPSVRNFYRTWLATTHSWVCTHYYQKCMYEACSIGKTPMYLLSSVPVLPLVPACKADSFVALHPAHSRPPTSNEAFDLSCDNLGYYYYTMGCISYLLKGPGSCEQPYVGLKDLTCKATSWSQLSHIEQIPCHRLYVTCCM